MSDTGLTEAQWHSMCQEQTPAEVRIDHNGRRAWGYRRIRTKVLMNFARRQKRRVTIKAPYVILDAVRPDEGDMRHEEMNMISARGDSDDEFSDDDDVFRATPRRRQVAKPILERLKTVNPSKRGACLQIFDLLSYIEHHKINFRLYNPRNGRAGINLVFQITNAEITHDVLEAMDRLPFVKENLLRLNQGKVLTMKINIF
tara:strand:- start:921 stop:1523 length:603 start_codon:yes stop_codon:yes gene_type:complete